MNLTNVGTNVYLSFVRVVFIREMRNVKAEFIIFVFFLSILLFLLLNDFEIRASGNIFERFSGERYDQTSKRNETINFKIETYPARDPPTVSLVRYGPRFLIFFGPWIPTFSIEIRLSWTQSWTETNRFYKNT